MWQYLSKPAPATLSMIAIASLVILGLIIVGAIVYARFPVGHPFTRQVRRSFGTAFAIWACIEALAILWRLLDMGDPELIPFVVLSLGVLLGLYALWYSVRRGPQDRQRFDRLREQLATKYAHRAGLRDENDDGRGSLLPLVTAAIGAGAFYLAMFPSLDHGLHQISIGAGGAIGWAFGLELTANKGIFALAAKAARRDRKDRGLEPRNRRERREQARGGDNPS